MALDVVCFIRWQMYKMSEKSDFGCFLADRVAAIQREAANCSHTETRPADKESELEEYIEAVVAKTQNCVQVNWRIPSEFPLCPVNSMSNPIKAYFDNLKEGALFVKNDYYHSQVVKAALIDNGKAIIVMAEGGDVKPYALAKIHYQDNLFVHTSYGTFLTYEGVEKEFALAQGLEWTGGETIDDLIG